MRSLYSSPLRVYVILIALSIIGIWSGFSLPISLYPNSSKPSVNACIGYDMSADSFYRTFGSSLESQLQNINTPETKVERMTANYEANRVCFKTEFTWGSSDRLSLREIKNVVFAASGSMPYTSRQRLSFHSNGDNKGFLALSFFSKEKSLTEIYKTINPILSPFFAKISDAEDIGIYNPQQTQVLVELRPEAIAASGIMPTDLANAIRASLEGFGAGSVTVGETSLNVSFPQSVTSLEEMRQISVMVKNGRRLLLGDLARIDFALPVDTSQIFKTSGAASVILWADPKAGGNIKNMAEDVIRLIEEKKSQFPPDIQYKALVDPSEFIRSAVGNVSKEVGVAAFLAVVILFLFVGNLKNVVTAAIEIPLSMVLAFILMKMSGMNLNLISLGGLALSAGMNVDASVVVMENIFRHFEAVKTDITFEERLNIVMVAVSEVKFSVIASTIASLVVFLPLAFTSDLSYAVLGDLAKAVVFSHGFSAIVALILVPTIRLQLMSRGVFHDHPSLLDKFLKRLEHLYAFTLAKFLAATKFKNFTYAGLTLTLALLIIFVIPRLDKEIIGKPDTDWLILGLSTRGNTLTKQMESQTEVVESDLLKKFGNSISYTFTQINSTNNSFIMARLKDKSEIKALWKKFEEQFPNTPTNHFWVDSWNPAELPIPNPPDLKVSVRGEDTESMRSLARDLSDELQEKKIWPNVNNEPSAASRENIFARIRPDQMAVLSSTSLKLSQSKLADLLRVATTGMRVWDMEMAGANYNIYMRFPENYFDSVEAVSALPININDHIVPLTAIAEVKRELAPPILFREDGHPVYYVTAKQIKGDEKKTPESLRLSQALVRDWWPKHPKTPEKERPQLLVEDSQKELNLALRQLGVATSLSILLIFMTMVFQFGDVVNSLLVLVAIPLGFIGVLLSLFVFHSTLSLNSLLGVILLNGISVANSIILVDFLNQEVKKGVSPRIAAPEVGKRRLRPILMTSLTTALGMLPLALGMGEGGKILQPLGIAVVGGLGFSLVMTLFVVPALQVSYMEWLIKRSLKLQSRKSENLSPANVTSPLMRSLIFIFIFLFTGFAGAETESNLSFAKAYEKIIELSFRNEIQRENINIAKAQHLKPLGQFTPQLNLVGREIQSGDPYNENHPLNLTASINLFRFGADALEYKSTNLNIKSQEEKLSSEILMTEDEALLALFNVIKFSTSLDIYQGISNNRAELVRIADERYHKGLLAAQEVEKLKVDLENSKAREANASNDLKDAEAQLTAFLGFHWSNKTWPWTDTIKSKGSQFAQEIKLESHPQFRAALLAEDSDLTFAKSQFRKRLPSLDLSFSYGKSDPVNYPSLYYAGSLVLTIPLFDQLNSLSNFKQAEALSAKTTAQKYSVMREIGPKFEAAQMKFQTSLDSTIRREKNLSVSRKLYDDNFSRFKQGRVSVNDLLIDQSRLSDAELLAIEAWYNLHVNYERLCHAGGMQVYADALCSAHH